MPGYRTHLAAYALLSAGLTTILTYYRFATTETLALGAAVGAAYTLLPDIDHPVSKARKYALIIGLVAIMASGTLLWQTGDAIYLLAMLFAGALLLSLILFTKHRKFFHTPYAALLFSSPIAYYNPYLAGYALLGYATHLLADRF
jgi:uncharacterized membrane protein HdeD (DUF308 family)